MMGSTDLEVAEIINPGAHVQLANAGSVGT
eukprot:SAG11_NODE_2177_length_3716_cov_2.968482_1_plen_30_part_00